jgi:hypothetical protein
MVRKQVQPRVRLLAIILCGFALGLVPNVAPAGTFVWWEGEEFAETNVPRPEAQIPSGITAGERAKLSGGKWLSPRGQSTDGRALFVTYKVQVPATGPYSLWVRKFWLHGPFRWRFDQQDWATCGRDVALHDDTYLRLHHGANWVFLGEVELAQGSREFRIEMLDKEGGGAIDCFLLTDGAFVPRGKLRPDEKTGQAAPGFFPWEPDADPLSDDCPISLRYLNEAVAGANGHVRREGNHFVLGDGKPVRFWMVQGSGLMDMKPPLMDYWAKRLAKYGVNLVRVQMSSMFADWKAGKTDSFKKRLDRLHYLVAALKKQGIYLYLGHLYWDTSEKIAEKDGFPGYGQGKTPLALLFFDPKMQAFYKRFASDLLATPNPYTGLPMSKDPGIAVVEIQNESSLLFWTFRPQSLVPQTRELMERCFGDWAKSKYGSIAKALSTWGPDRHPKQYYEGVSEDHPAQGRLGLYGIGNLTSADWAAGQRNHGRASDQLRFMVESMYGFYEKMVKDLHEEVGLESCVACSNWKTADPRGLGVLERYTYTAGDVVCRNAYFDVAYDPRPPRFYAIDVGDTFTDHSALRPPVIPSALTVGHVQDYPYMVTENNWCRPNRYRAEWPFLIGTYAAMMGVDGWVFFSLDSAQWVSQMRVWDINTPSIFGQFPATALAFRSGYITEAPAAVTDYLSWKDLYDFKGSSLYELSGKDALWESKIGDLEGGADNAATRVDRLAFFVGKVNRQPGSEASRVESVDLTKYIDHRAKTVKSLTDELRWDFGNGVVTVDTPCVQGACGFLASVGPIRLGDVTIEAGNDYASVIVISLDGKPIAESERILVQAGTDDQPYGYKVKQLGGGKKEIVELGGYPMNVRRIDASVTIKGLGAGTKAIVLDGNGELTDQAADLRLQGSAGRLTLPPESLYTLVKPAR